MKQKLIEFFENTDIDPLAPDRSGKMSRRLEALNPELLAEIHSTRGKLPLSMFVQRTMTDTHRKCSVCSSLVLTRAGTTCSRDCHSLATGAKVKASSTQAKKKRTETNLDRFGAEHSWQSEAIKDKIKQTNLERYGVENPQQNKDIKKRTRDSFVNRTLEQKASVAEQTKQTNLERYGVECALQSEAVKDKIKTTNLDRYGVENPFCQEHVKKNATIARSAPEVIEAFRQTRIASGDWVDWDKFFEKHGEGLSAQHYSELSGVTKTSIYPVLRTHNVDFKHVWQTEQALAEFVMSLGAVVKRNDRQQIAPNELDIFVEECKVAIEYNGEGHTENAMCDPWFGTEAKTHRECVNYHVNKTKACQDKGIRLLHVFFDQWQLQQDVVESIIKLALGKPERVLNARDCVVKELTAKQSAEFLSANHLYNARGAQVHLGLIHQTSEELVAVMTFGQSKFNKNFGWELIRYAPVLNTAINGAAHKLWKHFVKTHKPLSVICYADASLFTGSLYEKLGFVNEGLTPPNNWYIIGHKRMHRMNFTKSKLERLGLLANETLSAHQNMLLSGIPCIWDCGSYKLTWHDV